VAEPQEEVTQARAAVVLVEACASWAEKRAWESTSLLASAYRGLTRWLGRSPSLRVSFWLHARPGILAEAKPMGLIDKAADADRRWERSRGSAWPWSRNLPFCGSGGMSCASARRLSGAPLHEGM
jgi:hypothetical protein